MSSMPNDPTLFPENTARMAAALKRANVEVAVIASPVNVLYSSGAFIKTQVTIPERLAIHVLQANGTSCMIVCDIEEPLAKHETWIEDIRTYVEFQRTPIDAVVDYLAANGLDNARVGVEPRFLVSTYMDEVRNKLPQAQLIDIDDTLDGVRGRKSQAEIDLLRHAEQTTEEILYAAFANFQLGQSEEELGWDIQLRMREIGTSPTLLTVVSGASTAVPHATSTRTPIERGAMIKVDVGGHFRNYTSDFARVVYAGEISPEKEKACDTYVDIYEAIVAGIKPGITAADLFNLMDTEHTRRGIPLAAPHVGHSIGVGLHDEPLLHPKSDRVLEPGMILAIEPRAILTDGERIHLEDLVLVTNDGCEVFTDLSKLRSVKAIG